MGRGHTFTTTLVSISVAGTGLLAATYVPLVALIALTVLLILVTVLIFTAVLSKRKYRRDAAYAVFKLIIEAYSRPRSRPASQQLRPGARRSTSGS